MAHIYDACTENKINYRKSLDLKITNLPALVRLADFLDLQRIILIFFSIRLQGMNFTWM